MAVQRRRPAADAPRGAAGVPRGTSLAAIVQVTIYKETIYKSEATSNQRPATMRLNLRIWRQNGPGAAGRLVDYVADHVSPDMSFLEMLDVVNEGLITKGE